MIIKSFNKSGGGIPYEEVVNLLHESFKERLDAGLNFGCATFSVEDFKNELKDSHVFVAYDDKGKAIGTGTLTLRDKKGFRYASHEFLATSNKYKGRGIASAIFVEMKKMAIEKRIDFISSSTAVEAFSSVRYHKKNGFKIYRLVSFDGKTYYSYCFIYPIRKLNILNIPLFRLPLFTLTVVISLLFKRKKGTKKVFKTIWCGAI